MRQPTRNDSEHPIKDEATNDLEAFLCWSSAMNLTIVSMAAEKIIAMVLGNQAFPFYVCSSKSNKHTALPIYKEARRDRLCEALATLLPTYREEKVLNPDSEPESPVQDI